MPLVYMTCCIHLRWMWFQFVPPEFSHCWWLLLAYVSYFVENWPWYLEGTEINYDGWKQVPVVNTVGIILCMHPANERWRYSVTPSLIGWAHTQNDPWCWYSVYQTNCHWHLSTITSWHGPTLHILALCKGNPPVTGGIPFTKGK